MTETPENIAGLNREGGLLQNLTSKGGLIREGGLNRAFTVFVYYIVCTHVHSIRYLDSSRLLGTSVKVE